MSRKSITFYRLVLLFVSLAILRSLYSCFPRENRVLARSITVYVSEVGNDSWSGTVKYPDREETEGPFRTLDRALEFIEFYLKDRNNENREIIVELLEGTYYLPSALHVTSENTGRGAHAGIVFKGTGQSKVKITGGLPLDNWLPVQDPDILKKLNPTVEGKIYQTDLSGLDVTDFGTPEGAGVELFFNDQPMQLSRYPNDGFMRIADVFDEDPVDVRGTKGDRIGKFRYDDERVNHWQKEKDGWVSGYWFWDWSEQKHPIKSIDPAKQILEVLPPYHGYGYRKGQWFYGFNLLSEIDEPGEYYIDREDKILYFYPPSDIKEGSAWISVAQNLLILDEVRDVSFRGITFEGSRADVIRMNRCENVTIEDCIIKNSGDGGVRILEGRGCGIRNSELYGLGSDGVYIRAGNRETLENGDCFAQNNDIHHIARIKRVYHPGISLIGVGNKAVNNRISHLPHMAIYFDGNEHQMEYNEIFEVCYESNDAGAVYAGRNWTMRGNRIRYNYLHDISGLNGEGCVGVYLDDAFSGTEVVGNIFVRVTRAMMIGGGRDNLVLNNIFMDCVPALHVDARGMGWMHEHPEAWITEASEKGTLQGIAYDQPPYSIRYPLLVGILADEPKAPKGNVISKNICYGGVWDARAGYWNSSIYRDARPYLTMEGNVVSPASKVDAHERSGSLMADPLFLDRVDPLQKGFQLAEDSPALKNGFIQIPFEKIGLR